MRSIFHRLPGIPALPAWAAVAIAVAIAVSLGAAGAVKGHGESVGLTAARAAGAASAIVTWTPGSGTGYQWVFVAAKTSADVPVTADSIDHSTLRYAGRRLAGRVNRLEVDGLDADRVYLFGYAARHWDAGAGQWVWTEWELTGEEEPPAPAAEEYEPAPGPQIPPATMTQLADNVYQYYGIFSSTLVVVGDDGVLITDPNNNLRAASLQAEIDKVTDLPVTTIVLTHEHYDHAGGTTLFPDAEVICQRNCQANFDLDVLGDAPEVDRTFDDRLDITVGDILVELHYLGPGDGDATTIIYLPAEQIVVSADLYEPRSLTERIWLVDKHFTGVRHILNTVSQWPLTHAVNAHSPGTDPTDLLENVDYYNDLYDAVKAAVDAAVAQVPVAVLACGISETLPETLHLEQYRDWANYDTEFPAHVERMVLAICHGD